MDNLPLSAFDAWLGLRNRGILSEEQAIQEIRSLPPLSAADAEAAAERVKAPPPSAAEAGAQAQDVGTGKPATFGSLEHRFSSLEHRRNHFLLLHESVRPRDDGSLGPHRAVRDYLIATVDLLTDQQDAVVLDKAARLADAYCAETASAQALNLAGRVHFEPYSLGAGSMSYAHDVSLRDYRRAWAMGVPRPWSEPKRTDALSSEWKRFPGIEESFQRATAYFQRAADLDDGVERGRALAYLALIELTRATAGAPLDHPRLEGWLDEADRLLPTGADPTIWARLWLFVGDLRDPSVMLRRPRVHVRNFANMLAEYGLHATAWLYLSALECATGAGDFGQLTALAQILHPYLPHVGIEQARLHFTSQWWHFLPEDPTGCEQHLTGTPPETFLAYGQPAAAVHALLHARYDAATLDRVRAAVKGNGRLMQGFKIAQTYTFDLVGNLSSDDADPARTAEAAWGYLLAGCPDTATLCLTAMSRQLRRSAAQTGADTALVVHYLAELVAGAGAALGDQGHRLLQEALFELAALAALRRFPDRDTVWLVVHQIAKGFVLGAALRGDRHEHDTQSVADGALLRASGTSGFALTGGDWQLDGVSTQVAAPLTLREAQPGTDSAEQSVNWRRVYHLTLSKRLASTGAAGAWQSGGLTEVKETLGTSACLLTLLTGYVDDEHGNAITAELVSTSVRRAALFTSTGTGPLLRGAQLGDKRRGVIDLSVCFGALPKLLAQIQQDPLTRPLSIEAEHGLRAMAQEVPVTGWLEDLGPEVTTLYVWPHEAAHSLPFWLLPLGDGIVADRFTVSMLPCLEALFWADRHKGGTAEGALVLASADGGVPYGLTHEESVEHTAREIAAMFGCEALTGEQATPAEFLSRAGNAPFIHLAAHGLHDPDAPFFHCLFLAGEEGRLFADQILRCDLRAVRLVTLEACESLQVRYDYLDNVIGLAATLIRAGAGAVVGARWAVRPEVSAQFFPTLYQHLQHSGDVGAAFTHAQRLTRRSHPQYADWGAFCLMGYAG